MNTHAMRSMPKAAAVLLLLAAVGCHKNKPPVVRPIPPPPPPTASTGSERPPAPPEPVREPTIVPPEPVAEDKIASASLDDLNRNSPLKPVFFALDSDALTAENQRTLDEESAIVNSRTIL